MKESYFSESLTIQNILQLLKENDNLNQDSE